MSVIVTLRFQGDPAKLEAYAAEHRADMGSIVEAAKGHGLIAHRFYGENGRIMVVDEWPDGQSFQTFFQETRGQIEPLMNAAGVTSEPEVSFWRKLDTHDEVGWES